MKAKLRQKAEGMFGLFKTKKNEPTSSASRAVATDAAALSTRKDMLVT